MDVMTAISLLQTIPIAVAVVLQGYTTQDITGDDIVESADYALMENNVYFVRMLLRP